MQHTEPSWRVVWPVVFGLLGIVVLAAIDPSADDLSAWSSLAATLLTALLFLAALFGLRQIREARGARNGQVMADISRRWDGDEFHASRAEVDACGPPHDLRVELEAAEHAPDRTRFYLLLREANLYEDVALLEKRGALELETICDWIGPNVIKRWRHWREAVEYLRERSGLGDYEYHSWEELAHDVEASLQKTNPTWVPK